MPGYGNMLRKELIMGFENLLKKISGTALLLGCTSLLAMQPVSAEEKKVPLSVDVVETSILSGETTVQPGKAEIPAEQPQDTAGPTETPEVTAGPTETPEDTASPSEAPESPEPVLEGFVKDENGNTYFYEQGKMVVGALKKIEGSYYYFGKTGKMATGLKKVGGAKYYFSKATGKAFRGLKKIKGKVYYFGTRCQAVTGWKKINGVKYYFKESGARANGWMKLDGEKYYFKKNGVPVSGLKKIDQEFYYFHKNGKINTGLKRVDSSYYYFKASGRAVKEKMMVIDGKSYYFGHDGKAKLNGWMFIGKKRYYSDAKGLLKYYWKQAGGTWHLCNLEGKDIFTGNSLYRAWNKAQTMTSATSYFITVDTSACRVMVFHGSKGNWVPVKSFICSPGKSSSPTVKGVFAVGNRGYCFGKGFTCYYFTQFHGNYLFHSVLYYQGTFRKKDGRLGMHLSHGCVRLDINHAKWIYNKIPRGTKVYTYS